MRKLYVFLIRYYKIFHLKNPFYEKVKMTQKRIVVFEFFVTIGSFDCDHTPYYEWGIQRLIKFFSQHKFDP